MAARGRLQLTMGRDDQRKRLRQPARLKLLAAKARIYMRRAECYGLIWDMLDSTLSNYFLDTFSRKKQIPDFDPINPCGFFDFAALGFRQNAMFFC